MNESLKRWGPRVPVLATLAALAIIYGPLVGTDPLLERDDLRLITPLQRLSSPGQYVEAIRSGAVRDIQPVRDLSFLLDVELQRATGVGTFHLVNLLIWIGIALCVFHVVQLTTAKPALAMALTCLFALHPVFVGSVAWVAARKHLLSCLFILLATLPVLRAASSGLSRRSQVAVPLLYGASIFSQPITLLWPIWITAYVAGDPARRRDAWRLGLSCAPFFAICAALNYWYYTGPFIVQSGAEKYVASDANAATALLAWGRYFANIAWPARLSTSYDPGSALNLIGLLALPLFGFLAWKRVGRRPTVTWLGFFAFPLAIVATQMTVIFVSDTYVLTPAVGILCLVALLLSPLVEVGTVKWVVLSTALALILATGSWSLAKTWRSEADLWAHAYEVEATPNAMAKHAYYLASAGQTQEAIHVAMRLGSVAPGHPEYPYVFSRAIFRDAHLSLDEKIALLEAHRVPSPWFNYYLASLHAVAGHVPRAAELIRAALAEPSAFKTELPAVAAEAVILCSAAGAKDCSALVEPLRMRPEWNEERFRSRLDARPPHQAIP